MNFSASFKQLSRRLRQPLNARYAFRRLREYHSEPRSLEDVIHWAMHFGGGGYMRVKTMQIPSEILNLARAVAAIKPRIILEIGTASGGTALIWSYLVSEREFVTPDNHCGFGIGLVHVPEQGAPPLGEKTQAYRDDGVESKA